MPRFGTRALLVGFAVAAVWLSTFGGFSAAQDIRRSILLLILIASGFVAIYSRGRRRAFWSAFFVVMLLCGGLGLERPLHRYVPDFLWLEFPAAFQFGTPATAPVTAFPVPAASSPYTAPNGYPQPIVTPAPPLPQVAPQVYYAPVPAYTYTAVGSTSREALIATIAAGWTIGLSLLAGLVAAYIHAQLSKSFSESR